MMMKRWMMGMCAAAVASSGCTKSEVAADVDITLSGKVLKEDGQPLANTLLSMNRSTNSECIFSLFGGLDWKSVKTGADGTFSTQLLGADTQNGSTARCFELQIPGTGEGSYMYAQFLLQTETLQLPTLQQWTFTPSAAAGADGVSVSFKDISAAQDATAGEHAVSVRKQSSGTIWVSSSVHSPALLNDDLLEDVTDLEAVVSSTRKVAGSKTTITLYNMGTPVALPQRARVPVSRGASCTYTGAPTTACPLTDGNLGSPVTFQQGVREVVIQLPKPTVLRKAVLRNLDVTYPPTELVLEGSSDGAQWVALASLLEGGVLTHQFLEVPLSNSTPLSQVRLRATSSNDTFGFNALNEVSLFE
jgi:hypothetical protein